MTTIKYIKALESKPNNNNLITNLRVSSLSLWLYEVKFLREQEADGSKYQE